MALSNRIPVQVLTSQPVGTPNPAVITSRSTAPANVRSLGPAQPRVQFRDYASNRQQSAIAQRVGKLAARYDADQQVIPGVSLSAGTQQAIPHRLGRAFVGCQLLNPVGGYLAYKVARNTDPRLDAFQALLTCQNNVTADVVIW